MSFMYKLIIFGAIIVALGWVAYGIYVFIENKKEKNLPPQKSERLQNARKSFDEYAKKMATFEKKRYDKQ